VLLAGAAALAIAATAAVIATSLAHGARKSPPLFAAPNELARIDPTTRKVDAVVNVGLNPVVSAGSGRRVWVYSEGSGKISEIDTRTSGVIERTLVSLLPPAECCGLYSGPVLAADASGAWFVKGGLVSPPYLVHLPAGNQKRRSHAYPLDIVPTGVAVGGGSVWVVGRTSRDDEVLRVDPADGRVTGRTRFPASARIDSIAFGYGKAWVVSSMRSTLYRIDPQFRRSPTKVQVSDSRATRPELIDGQVWVRVEGHKGMTLWIDPASLAKFQTFDGPPTSAENVWGNSVLWRYDSPNGTVVREAEQNGPEQTTQVTRVLPTQGGPCLSSITIADGGVWVTAAPLNDERDSFVCQR
jgi:hypothetical protein